MDATHIQQIQTQHFEHRVWMNELKFYEDEVKIFEHQLEVLVGKGIKELLPNLEKFQNKFIRHKEVLDELMHDIKIHEHALAEAFEKDEIKDRKSRQKAALNAAKVAEKQEKAAKKTTTPPHQKQSWAKKLINKVGFMRDMSQSRSNIKNKGG